MQRYLWWVLVLGMVGVGGVGADEVEAESTKGFVQIPKTGQSVSRISGDDGSLQVGVTWPHPRFSSMVLEGGDVVVDGLTGLMWVKSPHALKGNVETMPWKNAVEYCQKLVFAGQTDWRLPNLRELHSLVDYGQHNPALPRWHPFVDIFSDGYWTGTSLQDNAEHAWVVGFSGGSVNFDRKVYRYQVWPVRGGM